MDWKWVAVLTVIAALQLTEIDAAKSKKASDYFKLCKRNDPNLAACVKNSIQEANNVLKDGIPEMKMPPLEPLFIPSMELREGQGNFEFVFSLKNLTMHGLKDYTVKDVSIDLEREEFNMSLRTPYIQGKAMYEMRGRLLSLPINGNGDTTLDFYNVTTSSTSKLNNITRNGKHYFEVESLKWNIEVGYAQSYFTNLFNGDKTLGETTNKFLNENWKEAFETYKHLPEEAFSQYFMELINRFYEQFTIAELFSD